MGKAGVDGVQELSLPTFISFSSTGEDTKFQLSLDQ